MIIYIKCRYCVLYTYGGSYIDDDSDMRTPMDKIIEPLDTLIVSYENNAFNADVCYIPKYHLSDRYMVIAVIFSFII